MKLSRLKLCLDYLRNPLVLRDKKSQTVEVQHESDIRHRPKCKLHTKLEVRDLYLKKLRSKGHAVEFIYTKEMPMMKSSLLSSLRILKFIHTLSIICVA